MTSDYWHRLISAEIAGPKLLRLYEAVGASGIWPSIPEITKMGILNPVELAKLQTADPTLLDQHLSSGGHILGFENLPPLLREVPLCPLGLYAKGDVDCLTQPTIGIVGTRRAGGYGRAVATMFGEAFARAGMTVVSGGAFGIDACAHEGALRSGGKTAMVLPSAIDDIYPKENLNLAEQVERQGVVISQFPISSASTRGHRPLQRNVVVAGLSMGLVVIEAPIDSGSLTTAGHTAELGRPVFVVPGMIDHKNFFGSHKLLHEGAHFVDHPNRVLDFFGIDPQDQDSVQNEDSNKSPVLSGLETEPLTSEVLAARLGMDHSEVLNELTMLELDGKVKRVQGKYAKRL